jgi:hypothetical protein
MCRYTAFHPADRAFFAESSGPDGAVSAKSIAASRHPGAAFSPEMEGLFQLDRESLGDFMRT